MRRILFLSTLILLTAAQLAPSATTNLVGGYASLSDLSSPDFQNVLAFIYANYPNLTNYQPTSVRKQLVNG